MDKKRKKKKKDSKKKKNRRGSSSSLSSCSSCSSYDSCSSCDSDCSDGGRYSAGTKVYTTWDGWRYSGTIVSYDSRNNTYYIVWEDGDESEWSERKVSKNLRKKGKSHAGW